LEKKESNPLACATSRSDTGGEKRTAYIDSLLPWRPDTLGQKKKVLCKEENNNN